MQRLGEESARLQEAKQVKKIEKQAGHYEKRAIKMSQKKLRGGKRAGRAAERALALRAMVGKDDA